MCYCLHLRCKRHTKPQLFALHFSILPENSIYHDIIYYVNPFHHGEPHLALRATCTKREPTCSNRRRDLTNTVDTWPERRPREELIADATTMKSKPSMPPFFSPWRTSAPPNPNVLYCFLLVSSLHRVWDTKYEEKFPWRSPFDDRLARNLKRGSIRRPSRFP